MQGILESSDLYVIDTAYLQLFSTSFSQCVLVLNEKKITLNTY